MRIQIISDIHCGHHSDLGHNFIKDLDPSNVDILILAGDISQYYWAKERVKALCKKFPFVIMVWGNHDFYNSSFSQIRHLYKNIIEKENSNFKLLDNSTVTIDNQRFVGTTLWFPDGPTNFMYKKGLNDFEWIEDFEKCVYDENEIARAFLRNTVCDDDIVITHHLPSFQCVSERFRHGLRNGFNIFYVCDMENLIVNKQPKIWVTGHSHEHHDIMIGKTRIVRNPLAYPFEQNLCGYVEKFIIEV